MEKQYKVLFRTGSVLVIDETMLNLIIKGEGFPAESKIKYINLDDISFIVEVDLAPKKEESIVKTPHEVKAEKEEGKVPEDGKEQPIVDKEGKFIPEKTN